MRAPFIVHAQCQTMQETDEETTNVNLPNAKFDLVVDHACACDPSASTSCSSGIVIIVNGVTEEPEMLMTNITNMGIMLKALGMLI